MKMGGLLERSNILIVVFEDDTIGYISKKDIHDVE